MRLKGYDLINKAIEVSAKSHEGHYRKASDVPYIVHPFEVAMILQENNAEDYVVAAGILHDTLEDTDLTKEKIEKLFGREVLNLVLGASEELEGRDDRPWQERKEHTISHARKASLEEKLIVCADKLSNIRSMIRNHKVVGNELWERFNAPYSRQKWYYESLVKSLRELKNYKMYDEFKRNVEKLFK